MKKKMGLIIFGMALLLMSSCSSCGGTLGYPEDTSGDTLCLEDVSGDTLCLEDVSGDTLCPDPPTGLVVELQPMGDFSSKEAELLEKELEEHVYSVYGIASGGIAPTMKMPVSCYYAPRKRYWAGKLLRHIHSEADITIGLTHCDISMSIHGPNCVRIVKRQYEKYSLEMIGIKIC